MLLLTGLLAGASAQADSVEPDLKRLIREAEKPRVHYGPARVGWNGPDATELARLNNPVYESLRLDSPAAVRRELKAVLAPDWQIVLAFTALIFGLRLLRSSRMASPTESAPAEVIPFPTRAVSGQEAA